jgi:hypothetical protein
VSKKCYNFFCTFALVLTSSKELRDHLGTECVADVVRRGRLGWFGHIEWRGEHECMKACQRIHLRCGGRQGSRGRVSSRGRMT